MEQATPGFSDANHKDRPSAALIGLAISMGASSLLVPAQGDGAHATELAAPETSQITRYAPESSTSSKTMELIPQQVAPKVEPAAAVADSKSSVPVKAQLEAGAWIKFEQIAESSSEKIAEQPSLEAVPVVASTIENSAAVVSQHKGEGDSSIQTLKSKLQNRMVEASPSLILHRVQSGETLLTIASAYGVSLADILKANPLIDQNRLQVDQPLNVPLAQPLPSIAELRVFKEATSEVLEPYAPEVNRINQIQSTTTSSSVTTISHSDQTPLASQPEQSSQTYVENLRADLVKLREKYQARKNRNSDEPPAHTAVTAGDPAGVPVRANSSLSSAVKGSESRFLAQNTALRTDIQKLRQQQRALAAQTQSSSWETATIPSSVDPQQIAKASLGSEAYEPFVNLQMGSPQLPPLDTPDTYLPKSPAYFNGYSWPAQGVLTSGYGWRWGRMHAGIDIAGPIGTPVAAAASGVVTFAGWDEGGYGNLVEIKHPDGSMTRYAHNDRILVREGQQVEQGEQLSEMGSTGFSTGPHLHFEIHPPGAGAQNPMAYLPPV